MDWKKILNTLIFIILLLIILGSIAFFGYIFCIKLLSALQNQSLSLWHAPWAAGVLLLVVFCSIAVYEKITGRNTRLIWRKVDGPLPDETGNPVTALFYCGLFVLAVALLLVLLSSKLIRAVQSSPDFFSALLPVILICVVVAFVVLTGLFCYRYFEQFFNPLTEEEIRDPLDRTITLDCSYKRAFDLCLESCRSLGRWKGVVPHYTTGEISVTFWWSVSEIRFVIIQGDANKILVKITGDYYRSMSRQLYTPLQERRQCIWHLDTIRDYLESHVKYSASPECK